MKCCIHPFVLALGATLAFAGPTAAQDIALKGGIAISRFQSTGAMPFDGSFRSTSFGGHARWYLGPIALQPEVHIVSKGASIENPPEGTDEERLRLDYMEIPLMLVLPVQIGDFQPYAFGGPMLSLETRCRSIVEEEGLTTNFGCDDTSTENAFDRRAVDWGVSAGAGLSHRLGSGRVLLEGRHTWGLRDIYDGEGEGIEVRNRTMVFMIGYVIPAGAFADDS